jgi:hypothetical protein
VDFASADFASQSLFTQVVFIIMVVFIVVESKIRNNGEHAWKVLCGESGALRTTNSERA